MLTLEQIRAMLKDRNLSRVSEATGISVSYLSMLRQGSRVNPSYQTIDALSRYLEREDAE